MQAHLYNGIEVNLDWLRGVLTAIAALHASNTKAVISVKRAAKDMVAKGAHHTFVMSKSALHEAGLISHSGELEVCTAHVINMAVVIDENGNPLLVVPVARDNPYYDELYSALAERGARVCYKP